ncbi:hypothetical protein GUJ93_ZPchr0004g40394 [Zizania palustris]|uniref:Uncharacterized protein n=1 Tax=Zizania palustris TaxID=103762 RepID=A0A8J5SF41_ZIZPA|nr:hypothetical protein GUJ93_ZPchr0004g40394 [Zizania palustris]
MGPAAGYSLAPTHAVEICREMLTVGPAGKERLLDVGFCRRTDAVIEEATVCLRCKCTMPADAQRLAGGDTNFSRFACIGRRRCGKEKPSEEI